MKPKIIKDYFLTGDTFHLVETADKGVLRTDPFPEDLSGYYNSKKYISHHQDSGSLKEKIYKFVQYFNLNYKRNILLKEAPLKAKVLDYGCGAGEFLKVIEADFTAYGFEPNHSARSFAKGKLKKAKLISDLNEVEDASLAAIVLWHVFEHIESREEILQIFYQKLKPYGTLIIAVPNHDSFDAKHYKNFWAAYDVPRHLYHYSTTGMHNYFEGRNWKIEKIKPLLFDAYYISMLSEKYKKNPLFWLWGPAVGAISNLKASKNGDFSSMIYIIKKN